MAEKTNANIGFEKQIWDAACVLWGHIPAAEYRIPFWNTDECCNCSALRDGYILSYCSLRAVSIQKKMFMGQ